LTVVSPIAGQVITWNAEQRLSSRPLRRGDALLTVADVAGPWQLELRVPSRSAGRLLAARDRGVGVSPPRLPSPLMGEGPGVRVIPVEFLLASDPGRSLHGQVKTVSQRVEIDPSGESYLLATVELPRGDLPHRVPGTSAVARISCGQGSLGEAWFHELLDAARLWLPF
jgi:hypothetical protein